MNLPLRMGNTLVQSTGRPYNGLPPPTLREKTKEKKQGWKKVMWSVIQHNDSEASVSYTYHRRGWSLGSSAVCRGKSARGRSTPSWWRGQLPPSTLGSLQKCRDMPAHLSRTGNIRTNSRHKLCLHILLQFILKKQAHKETDATLNSLTYSPLSCTLLFDWWLLCILLLVLPSSTGRQLSDDKAKQGEKQSKRGKKHKQRARILCHLCWKSIQLKVEKLFKGFHSGKCILKKTTTTKTQFGIKYY